MSTKSAYFFHWQVHIVISIWQHYGKNHTKFLKLNLLLDLVCLLLFLTNVSFLYLTSVELLQAENSGNVSESWTEECREQCVVLKHRTFNSVLTKSYGWIFSCLPARAQLLQDLRAKRFYFTAWSILIMLLSDTYNNMSPFCGCRLKRSRSILNTFQTLLSSLVT